MKYKFLIILLIFALSNIAWSQGINIQGFLRNPNTGKPMADDSYPITFTLYDAETGGTEIWSEDQTGVEVVNGVFSVILGYVNDFTGVSFDEPYWLGISVDGGTELTPRSRLTSAPYAISLMGVDNQFPASGNVVVSGGNIEITSSGKGIKFSDNTTLTTADLSFNALDAADGYPTDAMYVANDGNVGINNTSPTEQLDVDGWAKIEGDLTLTGNVSANNKVLAYGDVKTNNNSPFIIKRYTLTANSSDQEYTTNFSTSEWAAIVVGYSAGYGRINHNEFGTLLRCNMREGTSNWKLYVRLHTKEDTGQQADWEVDVMFINKNICWDAR